MSCFAEFTERHVIGMAFNEVEFRNEEEAYRLRVAAHARVRQWTQTKVRSLVSRVLFFNSFCVPLFCFFLFRVHLRSRPPSPPPPRVRYASFRIAPWRARVSVSCALTPPLLRHHTLSPCNAGRFVLRVPSASRSRSTPRLRTYSRSTRTRSSASSAPQSVGRRGGGVPCTRCARAFASSTSSTR